MEELLSTLWDEEGRGLEGVFKLTRDKLASTSLLSKHMVTAFRSSVDATFKKDKFYTVASPLLADTPRPHQVKLFIVSCFMHKKNRDKLADKRPDFHEAFRDIILPILIVEEVLGQCIRIIKELANKNNIPLALDHVLKAELKGNDDEELEAELKGNRQKKLEAHLKQRRKDGFTEWANYCLLLNPQCRAAAISEGGDYFAARERGFATNHQTELEISQAASPERTLKRQRLSDHAVGPQQGSEGDYELHENMASIVPLSAIDFYLGATVFDGLEESYERTKEGELAVFTAHVLLRLPRAEFQVFQLLVTLSARVGDEIAQAKGSVRKLRRKFGMWLSQATGLQPAVEVVANHNEIDPSHEAAAAAIQVFRHKNGTDRMLQVTLRYDVGWFLMENIFNPKAD